MISTINIKDVTNKLIKELKLHDATINKLLLQNNIFYFKIDCSGMNIKNIYDDIDNIYFNIKCFDIIKLNFDFDGMILIDKLSIKEENNIITIETSNNDLYIECKKYDIKIDITYRKQNNILDILNKIKF